MLLRFDEVAVWDGTGGGWAGSRAHVGAVLQNGARDLVASRQAPKPKVILNPPDKGFDDVPRKDLPQFADTVPGSAARLKMLADHRRNVKKGEKPGAALPLSNYNPPASSMCARVSQAALSR